MKRAGAWRVSQLKDDFCVIAASFGASIKEECTTYTVRGVIVNPVHVDAYTDPQGRTYRWYVFPDYRKMLVNEGNVREKRHHNANTIGKAASSARRTAEQPGRA